MELLSAVLPEGQPSSLVVEVRNAHSDLRDFLRRCDDRVLSALGEQRLGDLLRPLEISAKEWRDAGTRSLLRRLLPV